MESFVDYETPILFLRRLLQNDQSDKFEINIRYSTEGKQKLRVKTTINKARVLSKKINDIYQIDPTISEYEINILKFKENIYSGEDDEQISKSIKESIDNLLLSTEERIQYAKSKEYEMSILQILLGNMNKNDIHVNIESIKDAISYLNTELHSESISYLSNHLKEFVEETSIKNLDETILREIIDSYFEKSALIEKEQTNNNNEKEEIFNKLRETESSEIVLHFLFQIECEQITNEMKEYIITNLDDSIIDKELNHIIKQYIQQLSIRKDPQKKEAKNKNIEFEGDELKGIISYLKEKVGENNFESKEIKLSSGFSTYSGSLSNLIKYDMNHINDFYRNSGGSNPLPNEAQGWVEFDFQKRKINLSSYTIRTCGINTLYHPKSWRIIGSNDREEWKVLDRQTDNSSLNGKYKQHRFECENNSECFQYIRYIQDDSWYSEREHCVYLTCIEFFGSIFEE